MSVEILQGDCLPVLMGLPDRSVQMCVTSPPYFGLRDYGTATWEGGSVNCDHKKTALYGAASTLRGGRLYECEKGTTFSVTPYKDTCGKCGATRIDQQIGLESSVDEYVAKLVAVFREVRRVLRDDGVLWLNLGDSYCNVGKWGGGNPSDKNRGANDGSHRRQSFGLAPKNLIGIPWRVAFAMQADGWILRSDIIWHKPNPMPESVKDRPTKSHEYIFLLVKSQRYFYDHEAIKEPGAGRLDLGRMKRPEARLGEGGSWVNDNGFRETAGRNRRTVWSVATSPCKEAHFATFPQKLIEPCILAGSRPGDVVLDPFFGAGTTGLVALEHGRKCIGIELNPDYIEIARRRLGLAEKDAAAVAHNQMDLGLLAEYR